MTGLALGPVLFTSNCSACIGIAAYVLRVELLSKSYICTAAKSESSWGAKNALVPELSISNSYRFTTPEDCSKL